MKQHEFPWINKDFASVPRPEAWLKLNERLKQDRLHRARSRKARMQVLLVAATLLFTVALSFDMYLKSIDHLPKSQNLSYIKYESQPTHFAGSDIYASKKPIQEGAPGSLIIANTEKKSSI